MYDVVCLSHETYELDRHTHTQREREGQLAVWTICYHGDILFKIFEVKN